MEHAAGNAHRTVDESERPESNALGTTVRNWARFLAYQAQKASSNSKKAPQQEEQHDEPAEAEALELDYIKNITTQSDRRNLMARYNTKNVFERIPRVGKYFEDSALEGERRTIHQERSKVAARAGNDDDAQADGVDLSEKKRAMVPDLRSAIGRVEHLESRLRMAMATRESIGISVDEATKSQVNQYTYVDYDEVKGRKMKIRVLVGMTIKELKASACEFVGGTLQEYALYFKTRYGLQSLSETDSAMELMGHLGKNGVEQNFFLRKANAIMLEEEERRNRIDEMFNEGAGKAANKSKGTYASANTEGPKHVGFVDESEGHRGMLNGDGDANHSENGTQPDDEGSADGDDGFRSDYVFSMYDMLNEPWRIEFYEKKLDEGTITMPEKRRLAEVYASFLGTKAAERGREYTSLAVYCIFLVLASTVTLYKVDSVNSFALVNSYKDALSHAEFTVGSDSVTITCSNCNAGTTNTVGGASTFTLIYGPQQTFDTLNSFDLWWTWATDVLVNVAFPTSIYSAESTLMTADTSKDYNQIYNKLVGGIRIRQVRVKAGSCSLSSTYATQLNSCYDRYNVIYPNNPDTSSFLPSSYSSDCSSNSHTGDFAYCAAFEYKTAESLKSVMVGPQRSVEVDDGSGYAMDITLDSTKTQAEMNTRFAAQIALLKAGGWLDEKTRAVYVSMNVYNATYNLLVVVLMTMYHDSGGEIRTTNRFDAVQLDIVNNRDKDFFTFGIYVCFLLGIVVLWYRQFKALELSWVTVRKEVNKAQSASIISLIVKELRHDKFLGFFTCLFFSFGAVYRFMTWGWALVNMPSVLSSTDVVDLHDVARVETVARTNDAIGLFFSFAYILSFFRNTEQYFLVINTVLMVKDDVGVFLVTFALSFVGFAVFGHISLGTTVESFSTLNASVSALQKMIVGEFDFHLLKQANPVLTYTYFVFYTIVVYILLLNFFLAVLAIGFTKAKGAVNVQTKREDLVRDILKRDYSPSGVIYSLLASYRESILEFLKNIRRRIKSLLSALSSSGEQDKQSNGDDDEDKESKSEDENEEDAVAAA